MFQPLSNPLTKISLPLWEKRELNPTLKIMTTVQMSMLLQTQTATDLIKGPTLQKLLITTLKVMKNDINSLTSEEIDRALASVMTIEATLG